MDPIIPTYLTYLIVSVLLVVWVSRTLSHHGERFLLDVFHDVERARSVNQLLLVGFYLVNIGFVALTMRVGGDVQDARGALEAVVPKLGGVSLALGLLHTVNLIVLSGIRRRALRPAQTPWTYAPGAPGYTQPAGAAYAQPAGAAYAAPGRGDAG